ncbi:hypothetical protein MMC25_004588 [Agyrium rufum]|nr:hypothetical protein [Agyrium rufum]
MSPMQMQAPPTVMRRSSMYQTPHMQTVPMVDSADHWHQAPITAPLPVPTENLNEAMGELKIDVTGVAPYISKQREALAKEAAFEEEEDVDVDLPRGSGSVVQIPPSMMPSDDVVLEYFRLFFEEVHPYVPVVSKSYLYTQWNSDRSKISPLLLEAIFAAAARFSDDPRQLHQWLALAAKHENCFMDVTRLSTVQALLILLKAREAVPKRGYYFRSWVTVRTLIEMAEDLSLPVHHATHQAGKRCGYDPLECMVKTRIWQCIYICEMMVGGPQGKLRMSVETETVDFSGQPPVMPALDSTEYAISWQFGYLARIVRNVRQVTEAYAEVKELPGWGQSSRFTSCNKASDEWEDSLPSNLRLQYDSDGRITYMPSHFLGHLHCYYQLSQIMLHRPQVDMAARQRLDLASEEQLMICFKSAKAMCQIQEALLERFGALRGLSTMQRGVNFTCYSLLTCVTLYPAVASSGPREYNGDVRDWFNRTMRILEACVSIMPNGDMKISLCDMIERFTADASRPFELRTTVSLSSPKISAQLQEYTRAEIPYAEASMTYHPLPEASTHLQYVQASPITPPISASTSTDEPRERLSLNVTGQLITSEARTHPPMPAPGVDDEAHTVWNPQQQHAFEYGANFTSLNSAMLDQPANPPRSQWPNTIRTPSSSISGPVPTSMTQQSPHMYTAHTNMSPHSMPSSAIHHESVPQTPQHSQQSHYSLQGSMTPVASIANPHLPSQSPSYTPAGPSNYIGSQVWQDHNAVTQPYDMGTLKRRHEGGPSSYYHDRHQQVKRPR